MFVILERKFRLYKIRLIHDISKNEESFSYDILNFLNIESISHKRNHITTISKTKCINRKVI